MSFNPYAAGGLFGQYKKMKKNITETLANGYSSESTRRELSNEYQDDRVSIFFQESCIFVLWMKVVSALEGLKACGWLLHCRGAVVNWMGR